MDRQNLFRAARKLSVALALSGWAWLALPATGQAATGMQYEPAKGYPTPTGGGGASATDSGATGDDGAAGSTGSGGAAGNVDTPASSGGGCAIAGETSLPTGAAFGLTIGLAALARRRAHQRTPQNSSR
ncbi:MAG TPA: hypothetical protein VH374_00985 [Polyangia bacterium]|jgi:hypothetical protein|nr:hypothetical protein [Polyangia bacterium]